MTLRGTSVLASLALLVGLLAAIAPSYAGEPAPVLTLSPDWITPERSLAGSQRSTTITVTADEDWPNAKLVIGAWWRPVFRQSLGSMSAGEVRTVTWNGKYSPPKRPETPYVHSSSYGVSVLSNDARVTRPVQVQVVRLSGTAWSKTKSSKRHLRTRGLRVTHSDFRVDVDLFFRKRTPSKKRMEGATAVLQFSGERKAFYAGVWRARNGRWTKPGLVLSVPNSDAPSRSIKCKGILAVFQRKRVGISVPRRCLQPGKNADVRGDLSVGDRHGHHVSAMNWGFTGYATLP